MFNFFSKKTIIVESSKASAKEKPNSVEVEPVGQQYCEDDYKDICLDCTLIAKEIYSDKFEGSCIAILSSYFEILKLLKFRGVVNITKKGITGLVLSYDLNVDMSFEARIGNQVFNGIMKIANLTSCNIENEAIRVEWTGNNLPNGIMFQQCDSLIKTSRVKNVLTCKMKEFESTCMTVLATRYKWLEFMPVITDISNGNTGKVIVEYE